MEILIKASSPNLLFVYKFATKNADSSSISSMLLGVTSFTLRLSTMNLIISVNCL